MQANKTLFTINKSLGIGVHALKRQVDLRMSFRPAWSTQRDLVSGKWNSEVEKGEPAMGMYLMLGSCFLSKLLINFQSILLA